MRRDLVVIALLALALAAPSILFGPGLIDSAPYNYIWTRQFGDALARGELYPRWLPRSFEGLGSPTFYYYPPFAFYLSGGFAAAGLAAGQAINAAVLVMSLASGAAMRLWLGGRSSRPLLWTCLYMAGPYHLADWYLRAALAEYGAFIWFPLIALAIDNARSAWGPPLLAVAYAALIFTHLPVALLTSLALILPLSLAGGGVRDVPRLARIAAGLLVGLALAAPYLAPALTLQHFVSSDLWWGPHSQPRNWSVLAGDSPIRWTLRAWPLAIVGALAILGVAGGLAARRAGAPRAIFWAGLTVVTAILALGLPQQVWEAPLLSKVQFPWRILAITEFSALTAAAMAPRMSPVVLALAGAVSLSSYSLTIQRALTSFQRAPAVHAFDTAIPDAIEYLPAGFPSASISLASRLADLRQFRGPDVQGAARVADRRPDGGLILDVAAPGRVIVRRFYFPAWRVTRDGAPVQAFPAAPGRLLAFEAQPGRYEVGWAALPQERLGWALSLAGLAGLCAIAAAGLVPRRPRAD